MTLAPADCDVFENAHGDDAWEREDRGFGREAANMIAVGAFAELRRSRALCLKKGRSFNDDPVRIHLPSPCHLRPLPVPPEARLPVVRMVAF